MGKPARVIVVGSFNLDHVWVTDALPQPGATRSGHYHSGPGGKGFNQAIAATRAGAATCFIGALGDDPAAEFARSLAAAEGLALQVQTVPGVPTGTAGVLVDARGRNLVVVALGANLGLEAGFVRDALSATPAARVLLAQLESPPGVIRQAMEQARADGMFTMLNPAPADAAVDAGLLAACDLLTPNETEFAAILARVAGVGIEADRVAGLADTEWLELCAMLPARRIVVTLGGAGCVLVDRAGDRPSLRRFGPEPVHCVDSTGAGDAFNGATAAVLAEGATLEQALLFAGRYAALSTEAPGAAQAMPSRATVEARFPQ